MRNACKKLTMLSPQMWSCSLSPSMTNFDVSATEYLSRPMNSIITVPFFFVLSARLRLSGASAREITLAGCLFPYLNRKCQCQSHEREKNNKKYTSIPTRLCPQEKHLARPLRLHWSRQQIHHSRCHFAPEFHPRCQVLRR